MSLTVMGAAQAQVPASEVDRPGTWELLSVASDGTKGNEDSGAACPTSYWDGATLSDDDRYVAFASIAGNLDPRDVNGSHQSDIFVHDRTTGKTKLISVTARGALPYTPGLPGTCGGLSLNDINVDGAGQARISADGRFVAFSDDRPLTDDDEDGVLRDVFVADLRKGTIELVSVDSNGDSPNFDHPPFAIAKSKIDISGDGRYVVFASRGYALDDSIVEEPPDPVTAQLNSLGTCLPNQSTGACAVQIFLRDRVKDTTKMVSVSPDGVPANSDALRPSISDDGRFVVFETFAGNMDVADPSPEPCTDITGPSRGAKCPDIFIHDIKTGKTEIVSVDSAEQSGPSIKDLPRSSGTVVSDDGRYVIFGGGGDLAPNAGGFIQSGMMYVRDRKAGRTENVAVTSAGELLRGGGAATISDDGRYAYFAGSLEPGSMGCEGGSVCAGRLRHDLVTGQTDWIIRGRNTGFEGSIGASGQVFLEPDDGRFHDPYAANDDEPGATQDLFLRDLGTVGLGVGGLLASAEQRLSAPQSPRFAETGIIRLADVDNDALPELASAEVIGGRVVYRPDLDDFYVRIDVDRLDPFGQLSATLPIPMVYGVNLEVGESRYQLRIVGGPSPMFGLFRCDAGLCSEVASLRGGFGTVGEAVVTAVPVGDLNLEEGGTIEDVEAFASFGTYTSGPLQVMDVARVASP